LLLFLNMDTTQTLEFRRLLVDAVKRGASDLHLSVGSKPVVRVDGELSPLEQEPILSGGAIREIIDSILTPLQKQELEQNRDSITTRIFDEKIRAKIHIFFQEGFPSASFRMLTMTPKTPQELALPKQIEKFATCKQGLTIIAGTYGSGRTTLAMSILEHINRNRKEYIMTLERPIEYDLVGNKSIVNQREVGVDVKSIEDGLTYVQREDVDVLFVSELSSVDIIRKVLELSNAGMYIIAVMDMDSVVRVIEKIIASFDTHEQPIIQGLLADGLQSIIVQTLLPKIGGGLTAVHELLMNTPAVKTALLANRLNQLQQVIASSRSDGMISIDHELALRVKNREVLLEHAREHVRDLDTFSSLTKT